MSQVDVFALAGETIASWLEQNIEDVREPIGGALQDAADGVRRGDWRSRFGAVPAQLDRCSFCLGVKGGIFGNENVIQGALVCDHCSVLFEELTKAKESAFVAPEGSDADGALVRKATDRANQHQAELDAGARSQSIATDPSVTEDPDELEMYEAMKAANLSVCGVCFNTGWQKREEDETETELCACPVGLFLAKKLVQRGVLEPATLAPRDP